MYTIGEFSKIGKVSTKMLRNYDEIGLLLPEEINQENGYRYYSHGQVRDIILINKLKEYKFSLKEIINIMSNISNSKDEVYCEMKKKLDDIESELQKYKELKNQMRDEILRLESGKSMFVARRFNIIKDKQEEMIQVCVRDTIAMEEIGHLYGKCMEIVFQNQLKQVGPDLTRYYDEDFNINNADLEVCVPVDRCIEGITKIFPSHECIHTKFIGPFTEISEAYAALIDYSKEHNLKLVRPAYEKYIKSEADGVKAKDFITEVYFPVE